MNAEARRSCAAEVRARLIDRDLDSGRTERRLVVATDASGRGGGGCGYGWISETGQLGYGLTVTTQVHQAEMIAICRAALADRELLILSDNQGCVELINRVLENGSGPQRSSRHTPCPGCGRHTPSGTASRSGGSRATEATSSTRRPTAWRPWRSGRRRR